jgi:PrtD family type I secretion system ABC transporter
MLQEKPNLKTALKLVRHEFVMTGVFSFFINLLMLISPLFMLQVYDRVLTSRSELTLFFLGFLAVALLCVMALLEAIRSKLLVRTSKKVDHLVSNRLFSSVFSTAVLKPGQVSAQYFRDMDQVRQFMTGGPVLAFFDAPWVPIYIGIIFLMHPLLGLVSVFGGVTILGLAILNDYATKIPLTRANEQSFKANTMIDASLKNVEVVKALGMQDAIRRGWDKFHKEALAYQSIASDRAGALAAASKTFRMILQVLILAAGAYLAIHQVISPGAMIAASIIMGRGLAPIEQAIGGWRGFINAKASFIRLEGLLDTAVDEKDKMSLPAPTGHLTFDKVVGGPPGAALPTMRGISFEINPGDVVGVIGPTGAGKSTLARMMMGVWPARSGHVRLDGADVYTWNHGELGPHIGYLPQDVELFNGTVADNIARLEEPDAREIVAAANNAGIHHMVLQLPNGYDTEIGHGGTILSAGQRQRVGLARALYRDPAFIVLDEPNSNLDLEGENALATALAGCKTRHRTMVVISHRSAVLKIVDKILVLKDGQVAAYGPRDEVLQLLSGQKPDTQWAGNLGTYVNEFKG